MNDDLISRKAVLKDLECFKTTLDLLEMKNAMAYVLLDVVIGTIKRQPSVSWIEDNYNRG